MADAKRRFRVPRPGRLFAVRALVVLGTILALVSVLAIWVDRLALNTDTWVDTSDALLQDEEIREAMGVALTDRLYSSVDVAERLEARLPTQFDALAVPAAAGLRQFTERTATELLGRPRVQAAWSTINRIAHEQFVRVVEGGGPVVGTEGGQVVLMVRPLIEEVADEAGLGERVLGQIPEDAGMIVILESDELESIQTLMRILDLVASWLWAIALALWALAVYLSRGRRTKTLRGIAYGLLFVGLAVLVILRVGRNRVIESLVQAPDYEGAAQNAFAIVTAPLKTSAWTLVVIALLAIAGTWLVGAGRRAVEARRAAAPIFRDYPGVVWGVFAIVVLFVLLWGPIPATRNLVGIAVLVGLAALGLWAFSRVTLREFPPRAG